MMSPTAQTRWMPKKARANPKAQRQKTQIKAWRKHRDLSLAKLAERLEVEEGYEISEGQLSRIERGEQPYSQDLLEAIARILRCGPPDLINVDPTKGGGLWSIWEDLTEPQRVQAVQLLKVLKGTGTEG
jgi:transcriptional regulator with XRE-family HTH domain